MLPLIVEGAIVFREIAPGEIFDNTGSTLFNNVDLDQDGNLDFFTTNAGGQASLVPTGDNKVLSVVATLPDLGRSVSAFAGGEIIGESPSPPLVWTGLSDIINQFDNGGSVLFMCNGRVPIGEPPTCDAAILLTQTSYVGLEFQKDGETHYGWIGFAPVTLGIHHAQVTSWAWEDEPGKAIIAGAVPEPSSILLISLSSIVILRRKR